jgi:hypothetical protein
MIHYVTDEHYVTVQARAAKACAIYTYKLEKRKNWGKFRRGLNSDQRNFLKDSYSYPLLTALVIYEKIFLRLIRDNWLHSKENLAVRAAVHELGRIRFLTDTRRKEFPRKASRSNAAAFLKWLEILKQASNDGLERDIQSHWEDELEEA